MVIREWRGRALGSNAGAYPRHFRDSVLPQLRETPGFIGASLGERLIGDLVEFLVLTHWESFEAIRSFATEDIGAAVVEPDAVKVLIDFDDTVQHYEIVEDTNASRRRRLEPTPRGSGPQPVAEDHSGVADNKPVGFDPLGLPESNATSYPQPFRASNQQRWNRRVGDHAGLTNFGVNLTRIAPEGQSSSRHWHTRQDEFVYVLSGEVVLQTDTGEHHLRAGMCAGFPAGKQDGHRFVNRGGADVLLLVIGDRAPGDEIGYPDIDMQGHPGSEGGYRFTRKDGSPLD